MISSPLTHTQTTVSEDKADEWITFVRLKCHDNCVLSIK